MTKYKIGQIITSTVDAELEKGLSGEKVIIPKGNKIVIGADNLAHHIRTGMIQPLDDAEVEGYDGGGLSEYIYLVLKANLPLSEILEDYDYEANEIVEIIEDALDEIGIC